MVSQLALPYDHDVPTQGLKLGLFALIAGYIPFNLVPPVFCVTLWEATNRAAMAMPEAAVHKQRNMPTRQHNVWSPRQIFPVQSKSESEPMQ